MDSPFDPLAQTPTVTDDNRVEAKLASLIDIYGLALLDEPDRIGRMLFDACPDAPRQLAAIRAATTTGIAHRLGEARDDRRLPGLLQHAFQVLQTEGRLDAAQALWSLRAWAHAFALPTPGLPDPIVPMAVVEPEVEVGPVPEAPVAPDEPPLLVERLSAGRPPARPAEPAQPAQASESFQPTLPRGPFLPAAAVEVRSLYEDSADLIRDPGQRQRLVAGAVVAAVVVVVLALAAWFGYGMILGTKEPSSFLAGRPPPSASTGVVTHAPPVVAAPAPVIASPVPASPAPAPDTTGPPVTAAAAPEPESLPAAATATAKPPPVRPVVAGIVVPRVVEGAPFTVALRLGRPLRDIASIERRIAATSGTWPPSGPVTRASGLRLSDQGEWLVPFRAMDAPAHATIGFTVVDRDGTRSEPATATIDVEEPTRIGSATGRVVGRADIATSESGCTRSTCGTVVDARENETVFDSRDVSYRVVVRLDDRDTRTLSAPYRLQVGTRVRVIGERFIPLAPRR